MTAHKRNWFQVGFCLMLCFFINLQLFAQSQTIQIFWDPNQEIDLKGYKIHSGTQSRNYNTVIDVGNVTQHSVASLSTGVKYYFAVTAYDSVGNESDYSMEVTGELKAIDQTPPKMLSVVLVNPKSLHLTFSEEVTQISAEKVANYVINNGIQVLQALPDPNQRTEVWLTTSDHQPGMEYTLTVNAIQDLATPPNTIQANATFKYLFKLEDTTPPTVTRLEVVNTTHLNVYFSEKVTRASAENIQNYALAYNVQVISAQLNSDEQHVQLVTAEHPMNRQYTLTINNIKDQSEKQNQIAANTTLTYIIGVLDQTPPQLVKASLLDLTHVSVEFSELISQKTAEDAENYKLSDGIQIVTAKLESDGRKVLLTTTAHQYDVRYTLTVNNIQDVATPPNTILANSTTTYLLPQVDTTPPTITRVSLLTVNLVEVVFSEPVTPASAEDSPHYQISDGISVTRANLQLDRKTVYLITSTHQRGKVYSITVNGIRDASANANQIAANSSATYLMETVDTESPLIVAITVVTPQQLKIDFNEPITQTSAENSSHYSISDGIQVRKAQLQTDLKSVLLETDAHVGNRTYTITINQLQDRATPPNTILVNSTATYYVVAPDLEPPAVIAVNKRSLTHLTLVFTEAVEKASAENLVNYRINPALKIESATLNADAVTVDLITAEHERGKSYNLVINHIRDLAKTPNIILSNTTLNYFFELIDTEPPQLVSVTVLNPKKLEITFSEQVTRASAEKLDNYRINNGIEVTGATLRENLKVVWLSTSTHLAETNYTITMNHLQDRAAPANEIPENSTATYRFAAVDATPPQLLVADILSATKVDLYFSEPITETSAENARNYTIDKGIVVLSAELDPDLRRVHLNTTEHERGNSYAITVNNLQDRAELPNTIPLNSSLTYYFRIVDLVAPQIVSLQAVSETQLDINFSEPVAQITAEVTGNYAIDQGITISQAVLDANLMTVHLNTSKHTRGVVYTLTVNNVTDQAVVPNKIKANTAYSYSLPVVDNTRPTIIAVNLTRATELVLNFSEPVTKASAENTKNYQINNGISVVSATLLTDQVTVQLTTTSHLRSSNYFIQISGIKDLAPTPNEITPNSTFSYSFQALDQQGPEIVNLIIHSETQLEIEFNEALDLNSVSNTNNYTIDKGIEVNAITLDYNLKNVYLQTTPHLRGVHYTIAVHGIRDLAEPSNQIRANTSRTYLLETTDLTAPKLDSVRIWDVDRVVAYFSESLERKQAENPANYLIDQGIQVYGAELLTTQRVVVLKTSPHQRGRSYRLTVNQVTDLAAPPNAITPNASYLYVFESVDMTPPVIFSVKLVNTRSVKVEFSEKVDQLSAEKIENYQITNNIEVLAAQLDPVASIVWLTTTEHYLEGRYLLTAQKVSDRAIIPNAIQEKSTFAYEYRPNAILKNINLNHYQLDSLTVGDIYYVDRAYQINNLPEKLRRVLWLKTANSDRWRTDDNFLTFQVESNIKLYIGYDSRATSIPAWLEQNFAKTDKKVAVSDLSHQFVLWERTCPAGKIVLGGNLANGANGSKAMYVVLIEGTKTGQEYKIEPKIIPAQFRIYQNYPNPFNGGTKIRFDLASDAQVKLVIYNVLGQKIKVLTNEIMESGQYETHWDGRNESDMVVANGLYFLRFEVSPIEFENNENYSRQMHYEVRKLTFMK